jgi:hypothetical protein
MKHPKTNQVVRVSLAQMMVQPKHLIFKDKVQMDNQRVDKLFFLSSGFGLMYVILSAVFCNFSKLIHINQYTGIPFLVESSSTVVFSFNPF